MEVALRYKLLSLLTVLTLFLLLTLFTIQTALHCSNSSLYVCLYIMLRKVRTLLDWAHGLLSKISEWTRLMTG